MGRIIGPSSPIIWKKQKSKFIVDKEVLAPKHPKDVLLEKGRVISEKNKKGYTRARDKLGPDPSIPNSGCLPNRYPIILAGCF